VPNPSLVQTNVVTRVEYSGCLTSCSLANNHFAVLSLTPTPIAVTTKLYLALVTDPVTGVKSIHATSPIQISDVNLDTTGLGAAGCLSLDVIVGIAKNFIADQVKQALVDQVNNTLIPAIEQGFGSLKLDSNIALAGSSMHVKIAPSALAIDHTGVDIAMSSSIAAVHPTSCVPMRGIHGSLFTPGDLPVFGTTDPDGLNFDAGAALSDDLVNQALFAAWEGGLLCRTLDTLGGNPIDSSLLAVAGLAGPLSRLDVADGSPVLIVLKGYHPPTGTFGGGHTINLNVTRLEVSIFTEVHERMARIVALDLDADASLDLSVDAANMLAVALNLDPAALHGTVSYSEPVDPDGQGILALLPIIAGQLGPQLAGAIPPINLGNLAGVGLHDTKFLPQQGVNGVPNDTLVMFTGLAAAPGGCAAGGTSGCGAGVGSGCDLSTRRGGNGAAVLLALVLGPLAFVAIRRKRG
jgi:hypothetical protein